jgi:DNA sulfur modification protein DndC
MMRQPSLWEEERLSLADCLAMTSDSLRAYGERYRHWAMAFSGGKDSSTAVTVVAHLLAAGDVPAPESLTVLYADTRMELPPLQAAAMAMLAELERRGMRTQIVLPPMDERFFVYMFGRGVPPPKNRFRWCTPQIKVEPMLAALQEVRERAGEKLLMLTGVRIGESAARDARIALSCGRDGAECGQGWFQEASSEAVADTLAPILHWRVCLVWRWLMYQAPHMGFPTRPIAEAYGGDEAEEINARTGCVGCNLASRDAALDAILRLPHWAYLAPFKRLKPLYAELIRSRNQNGELSSAPMRMGPLTMDARRYGLAEVLCIQEEINTAARAQGRPEVSLISPEEHSRILELIEANTWPDRWDGTEVRGDVLLPQVMADGTVQDLLLEEPNE